MANKKRMSALEKMMTLYVELEETRALAKANAEKAAARIAKLERELIKLKEADDASK